MSLIQHIGRLKGPFRGFGNEKTRFTFSDGTVWRQNQPKYVYFYSSNPCAWITYKDGVYLLQVEGMDEKVEVVKEN